MSRRISVLRGFIAFLVSGAAIMCASARTPLNTDTPLGLFTSLADNFLQSQAGISVTNIPVFTNNTFVYTPAIHRLLQLAANITDATTNRHFLSSATNFYPSVFRPIIGRNGSNVLITGYEEVPALSNLDDQYWLVKPLSLPEDINQLADAQNGVMVTNNVNIYGVPWTIGAIKGLPNFNQFAFQTISHITRRLDIDKTAGGNNRALWKTNQMYIIGVSNVVALDAWNSYSNPYPRNLFLVANDDLSMTFSAFNATNPVPIYTTNLPVVAYQSYFAPLKNLSPGSWPGFESLAAPAYNYPSFQSFRSNIVFIPDMQYNVGAQTLVPTSSVAAQFEPLTPGPLPQFVLSVTNRLRMVLVDNTDPGELRVVDYVQFGGANGSSINATRNLTAELVQNDPLGVWTQGLSTRGVPTGPNNQLQISLGSVPVTLADWNNAQIQQSTAAFKANEINFFDTWFNGGPGAPTNLVVQVPFTPTAEYAQSWSWQANDPLVHYTTGDLNSPLNAGRPVALVPPDSVAATSTNILVTGTVTSRYHPWQYYLNQSSDPFLVNPAAKDASVVNSDSWNFPSGQPLSLAWLGQVHRGTPWQTVYLKSGTVSGSAWQTWTGDTNYQDSLLSQPTNDWRIASLLVSLLNTNSPVDLLSVNQINLTNWSSTFSNGITVLTNVAPGQFTPVIMDSNSPQTAVVVNGINAVRASQPGGYFHDISTVLAAPELTINSPWLNPNVGPNGISDAAYEMIPSQILSSLRIDSEGSIQTNGGQVQLQFTGFDGYPYNVQASTNLRDWSTIAAGIPSNGVFSVSDSSGASSNQKFYRSAVTR